MLLLITFSLLSLFKSSPTENKFPTDDEPSLYELHDANYSKKISASENIFVFYYSPFCKYSISLASEYVKVAAYLKNFDFAKNIVLAKFNVNQDKETAEKMNVEGTPVFRYYRKGRLVEEYEGQRTSVGVYNFILQKIGMISTELLYDNFIESFKSFSEAALVFFGDEANLESFKSVVRNLQDEVVIGHVPRSDLTESILKKYAIQGNKVVLFVKGEVKAEFEPKSLDTINAILDFSTLKEFLSSNLYDEVLKFNEQTSKLIFQQGKPGLFFYSSPKDYNKYHEFIVKELPSSVRDKMVIFLLGAENNELIEGRLFSLVSANHTDFPSVKIHQRTETLKTETMKGDINVDNVVSFVEAWLRKGFAESKKEDL